MRAGRARDALLLRGLHLLTLAVHVMSDDDGVTEGGDGNGVCSSDVEAFCSAILEVVVRPPSPSKPVLASSAVRNESAGVREVWFWQAGTRKYSSSSCFVFPQYSGLFSVRLLLWNKEQVWCVSRLLL